MHIPGARICLGLVAIALLQGDGTEAQAQTRDDRLTPWDVFDLEFVVDPRISPDGRSIVYVRRFSSVQTDGTYTNLWIVGFDGSGHRPLTDGAFHDDTPRWSPSGDRVLFVSDRGGSSQIHVRWMDSGQTAEVTTLPNAPRDPAWSPDGRWIAFTSIVDGAGPQIAQIPEPPEGATWAPPAKVIDRLVHRFDGVGELGHGYSHVFVLPATGGTARQLSSGNFHHGGGGGRGAGKPTWTPDGQHVLISSNRRPDWQVESRDTEVYELSIADGQIRALTDRTGPDGSVAVSPDGRRIAYVGYDDRRQGFQVTHLYMADRDGGDPTVLAEELDRSARAPSWASDGHGVYFLYDDFGNSKLALATLDGGVDIVAENVGGGGLAYGGGGSYTVAGDRYAYTYSVPSVLSEVATGTVGGSPAGPVTAINEDVLGHKTLGDVEEIRYASSRDGREIQGWIIKPPDFDPNREYPLILEIHGGPFANYGDRFDIEKQVMAAAGFVVLYTNPRGSTSYGQEFGNLIHHAYPGDDFADLDAGVDELVARGYVDEDQLYITGGSGGGVLTTWTVGQTDRYKAAAVLYPVINWYSFAVTSDIPVTVNKYWFPVNPWDDPEGYMERSTISSVGNVTTPTLIMTGEEDYRTPMSESEQYYQALKLRGVESVLIKVPGESHGIRDRPSHWMQKLMYVVGWFDRFRIRT